MIAIDAKNEQQAKAAAVRISKRNAGQYVLVTACYGLYVVLHKRLGVHAPGDTPYNWYVLNGRLREFTDAQQIAEQNACIGRD